MCDTTTREWIYQYNEQQLRAVKAEQEADRFRAVLEELVILMQAIIEEEYVPNSFTLQPAREALKEEKK